MSGMRNVEAFSKYRLGGEPVPADVVILIDHQDELLERTGIELNWKKAWAPWSDTSYLSPEDWANPDIAANVRAIGEVCGMIAFVAANEDREYFGYWLGLKKRAVEKSPLVRLDNEGQFSLCGVSNFAEVVLSQSADDEQFDEWRSWLVSLGVEVKLVSLEAMKYPEEKTPPDKVHNQLYRNYLGQSAG